ncbi:EF-hand domain-containing protein [Pontibacter locisalis]|uniref:EF-hand domain-containing protein n=1 Tax=Pontibacter locisalis TaxID=1719035 RepID=A0ABW5IRE5_9BACT
MNRIKRSILSTCRGYICLCLLPALVACGGGEIEEAQDEALSDDEVMGREMVVADTWDEGMFFEKFAASNKYGSWDLNDDEFLDEEEFTSSFYQTWDLDGDGRISKSEWDTVVANYGVEEADWTAWDTDGDGYLEMAEFEADFAQIGWHSAWDLDKDSMITEREWTAGVYQLWDTDGDNQLDRTEYIHYNKYYGQ